MATNEPRATHAPFRSFETCVCGAVILPDSHFCRYCGASLDNEVTPVAEAAEALPHPDAAANGSSAPSPLHKTPMVAATPCPVPQAVATTAAAQPVPVAEDTEAEPAAEKIVAAADSDMPANGVTDPVVEFDFGAVDRAESRRIWSRLVPLSLMVAALCVLLAWGIGQNRRGRISTAPAANTVTPAGNLSVPTGNTVEASAPESAPPGSQFQVSNATPRPNTPVSAGARPTPARAIPPAGVTRNPSLPLPAPPVVNRVPSGVDPVDTGGVSSGGGPYAPGSGRAPVARIPSGQIPRLVGREEGVGNEIKRISSQLTAGTGDAADLHLRRGNLYMQTTENDAARADYNAAISIYNDRIKRGVRVEESRAGVAAAQRGLQMLP